MISLRYPPTPTFFFFFHFFHNISRQLKIDEAIQSTEEIQSVILLLLLTCLTEQKERDGEGGERIDPVGVFVEEGIFVCLCVRSNREATLQYFGEKISLTFIIQSWW